MDHVNKNPAAPASADRVISNQAHSQSFERHITEPAPFSLAVRLISNRYQISIWHARTVCQLAGIGGDA